MKIYNAAPSQIALNGARRFVLDLSPRPVRNRSQLAMQVIHEFIPFSDPIPSDPSLDGPAEVEVSSVVAEAPPSTTWEGEGGGSAETSSRNVAVGTKNRLPVTAVLKSRLRS